MDKIRTLEDLIAWQEAHKLTLLVYRITAHDLKFVQPGDFQGVMVCAEKIGLVLGGLIRQTEHLSVLKHVS